MRTWPLVVVLAACSDAPAALPDAPATVPPIISVTFVDTSFSAREHMIAGGEMQISGEPLAEAMGRDLSGYSRAHVPTDLYFDPSPLSAGAWLDATGFSTGVESYEYSKQPMNSIAFESGAGTAFAYAPLVNSDGATGAAATQHVIDRVQAYAAASNAAGRFVFPIGTYPRAPAFAANNLIGWPGMWPSLHLFDFAAPEISPSGDMKERCSISSDDDPGATGSLPCADYECDATTLHIVRRLTEVVSPGSDGFATWKYALWAINYLQVMHDDGEAPVDAVPEAELALVGTPGYPVHLGSSDIEGLQAQLLIAMVDNRAEDWLMHLATADNTTFSGFATLSDALAYSYASPLRWFDQLLLTEVDDGGLFPRPVYELRPVVPSSLLDLAGIALGYATIYALTDRDNADVGGLQSSRAFFDGDPFSADNGLADGESTLHDRALAMVRVAVIDMDRIHIDPATGLFVDSVTMTTSGPQRATQLTTIAVTYTLLALRAVQRATSSQLQLYSNNTPDSAIGATPLDALPIDYPGTPGLTFSARVTQLIRTHAELLYDQLTTADGHAFASFDVVAHTADQADTLDAHTAAVRGLFAAYLATGDTKYRDRALAVFARIDAVFYYRDARVYTPDPAPEDDIEMTPLRFALLQSTLRDMYELVATRPGGEALEVQLEDRIGRLNKLVLNGWDDRNGDRLVEWPEECVNVVAGLPRGGLQMAERTLTGETGIREEHLQPGQTGHPTSDRDSDCVPEIDDAQLPAQLAGHVMFHVTRPSP